MENVFKKPNTHTHTLQEYSIGDARVLFFVFFVKEGWPWGVRLEGPGTSPQDVQSHGTLSPSLSVDLLVW